VRNSVDYPVDSSSKSAGKGNDDDNGTGARRLERAAAPSSSSDNNPQKQDLFVLSHDTLRSTKIYQTLPSTATGPWRDHPPIFTGPKERHLLKEACRGGVPPALRCAVWITSVIRVSHCHRPKSLSEEYGTVKRVPSIEHTWNLVLDQTFPERDDESMATIPDFGLHSEDVTSLLETSHGAKPIPPQGRKSLTRVLCVMRHMHSGIEYAPLVPDLAAILLNYMPEAYVYTTLREMVNDHSRFLPPSKVDHYSYCRTFAQLMKKMHPATAREMEDNGALTPRGLDPIFRRFFTTLLPYECVLRIMDIFTIEGAKVLFRFGVALVALYKTELKSMNTPDAKTFWLRLREYAHSKHFSFERLVKKAYGPVGSKWRKRVNFPRRRTLARMVKFNEDWAECHVSTRSCHIPPPPPLGCVKNAEVEAVLAKPTAVRAALAQWMPLQYRSTKLDLIFSTNVHGRSLSAFYEQVSKTKHTVCLVEMLSTGATIGCFASQAWVSHKRPKVYGDGECFLFRATPEAKCYKWRPSEDDTKTDALLEQFQVSSETYIAMGGNKDGSSGLRLNEDLTKGESAPAVGFNNDPLAGSESDMFEIGLVEVYRLVREIDGRPVDGEDDPMWNLDGCR